MELKEYIMKKTNDFKIWKNISFVQIAKLSQKVCVHKVLGLNGRECLLHNSDFQTARYALGV